jgi:hypothetical protein
VIEDHFLPVYDVSDGVATVVKADAARTWAALMEVDLIELGRRRPLIGMLGALRIAPELVGHLLRGEPPAKPPKTIRLRDMTTLPTSGGGWVLLAERPPEAIALGLVGKFWKPVIEFAEVTGDDFRDFSEPGYAKTVYALSVKPLDNGSGTLLSAVMRTAPLVSALLDPRSRFRRASAREGPDRRRPRGCDGAPPSTSLGT